MTHHLPEPYTRFRDQFPNVADALDGLGAACDDAGPLDDRTQRLVKLGLAIGALAQGAVGSNTRRALEVGATEAEIRHVAVLAITTCGFPTSIAGMGWIDDVLESRADTEAPV